MFSFRVAAPLTAVLCLIALSLIATSGVGQQAQQNMLWSLLGINLVAAVTTVFLARMTINRWAESLRDYIITGKNAKNLPKEAIGVTREIRHRLRQLERERQRLCLSGPMWSSEALFRFVREHLPSEQIISISYRQPYAHKKAPDGGLTWMTPASGLVTAIEPIMKACGGTWIAVAMSEADRLAADQNGALMVPPDKPTYRLKRLWLSEEETAGFYAGFANEGLWPLATMAYVKPRFRASDWKTYQEVNQRFADAIVAEAKSDAPIVFIQDYHFALLPKLVRERLPNALIIFFWHIPWPNAEAFGILPWREEILRGLLPADIIGFHTQAPCNNFLDCVDTHIEALIDREHNSVRHGNDFSMVRPYPISIAWPDLEALSVPDIPACRKEVTESLGIAPDAKIILGVERLDYVKGIPERLRSFGIFLEKNPLWRGKVCFVQIASPSRSSIPAYADADKEVEEVVAEINKKYQTSRWKPIHLLKQNYAARELYRFYRSGDVFIVSSLSDGMNLVAKEFISARDDDRGSLILSEFTGSSRELVEAIIVNPHDEEKVADCFLRALTMSDEEQTARMKSMRERVKMNNVFAWAAQILGDAKQLHDRRQLNELLEKTGRDEKRAA
ncbi:MAG: trehalose-6-phosphate synthase [Alphaproteobacteria bacterium]|nr:trehalose-6-phosphate synthase [Alphaproteobacteria bacterium]